MMSDETQNAPELPRGLKQVKAKQDRAQRALDKITERVEKARLVYLAEQEAYKNNERALRETIIRAQVELDAAATNERRVAEALAALDETGDEEASQPHDVPGVGVVQEGDQLETDAVYDDTDEGTQASVSDEDYRDGSDRGYDRDDKYDWEPGKVR